MKKAGLFLIWVMMAGCAGTDEGKPTVQRQSGKNIDVYISADAKQCESPGLAPATTAQTLAENNVTVVESRCGRLLAQFIAMCGADNGAINIHSIDEAQLIEAQAAGFAPVSSLANQDGAGYQIVDCSDRR